jgi:hypothetical protein
MNSRIRTGEWVALLGTTILIDIGQFILDFFVIGVIINRFLDVAIGFLLPVYFWLRGVNMSDWKKLLAAGGAFGLEEVGLGGDDGLPFWSAEVGAVWVITAAEQKLGRGGLIEAAEEEADKEQPLNRNGVRLPQNVRKPLNRDGIRPPNRDIRPPDGGLSR